MAATDMKRAGKAWGKTLDKRWKLGRFSLDFLAIFGAAFPASSSA
jgi:hypothetical protein